jgi:type VI secretion system protein
VSNNSAIAQDLGLKSLSSDQLDQLSPELALIVKETLNRLIDLLRARSSIKNELRVDRTMIENHNNNPLKFSVAAEDALAVMFSAQAASFMPPHLAVADGFNDISDHQVAVMSGMKAAYEFMLEQFSPQRIQQRNTQKRGGILTRKEAQNWQSFEQYYQQLQQDKERTYNTIFGETFASAYEQQLADLKATRSITQHQNPRK